jgi:hypothetical protein
VVVAFVGIYQFFIDPNFFFGAGKHVSARPNILAFGGYYRVISIFTAFRLGEGWVTVGFLMIWAVFAFKEKSSFSSLLLVVLALLNVALTFTRAVWLAPVLSIFFLLVSTRRMSRWFAGIYLIMSLFILFSYYQDDIESMQFYQERVLSPTAGARQFTSNIFFTHLVYKNVLFGHGADAAHHPLLIQLGRKAGLLNGFLNQFFRGGIIGILLFISIFYFQLKHAYTLYQNKISIIPLIWIVFLLMVNFTSSEDDFCMFYWVVYFVYTYALEQNMPVKKMVKLHNPFLGKVKTPIH